LGRGQTPNHPPLKNSCFVKTIKEEITVNKLFKTLSILAAIALFITACGAQAVQAQIEEPAAPEAVRYQAVLGQRVHAKDVVDFIASHNCTPSGQFQLCQYAGLAFWADEDQIVQTVYLYVNNSDDFAAYKGQLPFGLRSNDTMATVEQKMGQPNVQHAPRPIWQPSLPDDGESPKLTYYRANYERFGMSIIYNSPAADEDAYIYAILLSN
jgi:hypothetical protein